MTDLEKLEEVLKHPKILSLETTDKRDHFMFVWAVANSNEGWSGYTAGETLAEALKSVREELGLEDKDD